MAATAGSVLGAAAGCGIPDKRLLPVRIAAVELIRQSGATPAEMKKAQSVFEYMAARATVATRADPGRCPEAMAAFEQAERERP